jgi:hypothetical protein
MVCKKEFPSLSYVRFGPFWQKKKKKVNGQPTNKEGHQGLHLVESQEHQLFCSLNPRLQRRQFFFFFLQTFGSNCFFKKKYWKLFCKKKKKHVKVKEKRVNRLKKNIFSW